jgi:hypothetical protein
MPEGRDPPANLEDRSMTKDLKAGDKVEWQTSQGKTQGTVKKTLTAPMDIKGHHVAASKDNPEILVETDKSHQQAAHKPGSLKKR